MNAKELKKNLQSLIEEKLSPLIDNDYVYWDLPYHINIGDTLIWQGTLDFLARVQHKCLDMGNFTTAHMGKLSENTVILLHGGGNFGDIYGSSQDFRKTILKKYPNNKIIVLPQTVYFKDKEIEVKDFKIFASHKNFYLCVRDQKSYDIACQYLAKEKILLLPDMAFCIKDKTLAKVKPTGKKLLMHRIDVEAARIDPKYIKQVDIQSDWPTFEKEPIYCLLLRYLNGLNRRINQSHQGIVLSKIINFYANHVLKPKLIRSGIDFINSADVVYTTRLHGCILSLLLDKQIILLDNSYGKNKGFYEAWLKDSDNIKVESC